MLKSIFKSVAFASVLALSAGATHATTVSYQGGDAFGTNGHAGVTVTSIADPVKSVGASAGGFSLKGNIYGTGSVNFVAWCLDITHYLASSADYVVTNTPFIGDALTAVQQTNIGKLFNSAYAGLVLTNSSQSAGFQLALWEIIYENPANVFVLASGNLQVTGDSGALAAGQAFLNNLSNPATQAWNLTFLQSTGEKQNLVTATPVPVPAAMGLMLLALGGLAAVGRRRRAA